jgi:hypothetical protein
VGSLSLAFHAFHGPGLLSVAGGEEVLAGDEEVRLRIGLKESRSLDRRAEEEQREAERNEKALADYRAQLNRPVEHARLKELMVKKAELNALLDLDKNDAQMVAEVAQPERSGADPIDRHRIQSQNANTTI